MTGRKRIDPLAIVKKLAAQEKQLLGSQVLAPVVPGSKVRLRLDGAIYELVLDRQEFEGWAIMQVVAPGQANFVEQAPPLLVGQYLKLFPRIRMVLIERFQNRWWALAASSSDTRIQLTGPAPVQLVTSGASFETVNARFDGSTFWFEGIDRRRDPAISRQLRQALADDVAPQELHCKGMIPREQLAYKMLFVDKHNLDKIAAPPDDRTRIGNALSHADARLESFWYQDEGERASVRFVLGGKTHVVEIRPGDLSVVSAGICLDGRDRDFDLTSLVSVLREYDNMTYDE
jgi:hypothetical protein